MIEQLHGDVEKRGTYHPPWLSFSLASFLTSAGSVLNGWNFRSLGAQNISRCIKPHCGVLRSLMLGLLGSLMFGRMFY
jgi:hypothetical protein